MIKKFRLYILSAAMALSASSCLDKMPEDGIPFDESLQTVSDVNLAVIGIYDAFKSKYLYSGNLTLLPDLQADFVYGVNGNTNIYGDIWRWKDIKSTNTDIEAVYCWTAWTTYGRKPPTTKNSTSWTNVAVRLTSPVRWLTPNW